MITEETKQKILRANEMRASNPKLSMSAILKEVGLSATLYYYHKRQGTAPKARAKVREDFPDEVKAVQNYKKKLQQLKLDLINELGI